MNINIILASASPRRKDLLNQVGLECQIIPSNIEEAVASINPEEVVNILAAQKAAEVAGRCKENQAIIIGADTTVAVAGQILGKPKDADDAVTMLKQLQGRTHQVYTGVTMIFCHSEKRVSFVEKTEVQVYPMTISQIENYVATKEPMDKAGAYGIQGYFAAYIKGIAGDYNNVVGLPVARLCRELERECGLLYR